MDDKIIGSEDLSPLGKGVLPGQEGATGATTPATEVDVQSHLYHTTRYGGLDTAPQSFEDKGGHWQTIRSDNPFEVLFLDYTQYKAITPDIVKKNYEVLQKFWDGKRLLMNGGARERIKARYGEETVNNAHKILEAAYNKLKTAEGIELYYREIEKKRYQNGIAAIQELADLSLDDGELTRKEAARIAAKGIDNGLSEEEVKDYLLTRLKEAGFQPRSSAQHDHVFDNQWMTDSKWSEYRTRQTEWLNTTVSTLEQVGEVTFTNIDKAYQRLTNANYLPVVVTRLTNDDKGYEFETIINGEKDADRRFLKVVYRLNPSLPFRLGNLRFKNIRDLLAMTAGNYALYADLFASFQKQHVQIWLAEADPSTASLITGTDYTDFLRFIYQVNPSHPFYLKEHRFESPAQLAAAAKDNVTLWPSAAGAMYYNELPVWFAGTGHRDWVEQYNEQYNRIADSDFHTTRDKEMAAVQTLLQVIDSSLPQPELDTDPNAVKMLAVEGSGKVQYPVTFQLATPGFIKARLRLSAIVPGISLSEKEITLHSQNAKASAQVFVQVDGMALTKDKLYSLSIIADTIYGQVLVPLEVKVVFPKKSYIQLLVKYGVIGALLFAGIRFLLSVVINDNGWLTINFFGKYLSLDTADYALPPGYAAYILLLALFLALLVASVFIIRKVEKL